MRVQRRRSVAARLRRVGGRLVGSDSHAESATSRNQRLRPDYINVLWSQTLRKLVDELRIEHEAVERLRQTRPEARVRRLLVHERPENEERLAHDVLARDERRVLI